VALNDGSAAFFYDKVLNITWLSDWNVNGGTTWGNAMTWAESLSIGGYSDWRLPTMTDLGRNVGCDYANFGTDCGYNVETRTSELANMFYNTLGNLAVFDTSGSFQAGSGLNNTAYFKGIQLNAYWFGVEYAPSPSNAWIRVGWRPTTLRTHRRKADVEGSLPESCHWLVSRFDPTFHPRRAAWHAVQFAT
jgi:hypothetical protein